MAFLPYFFENQTIIHQLFQSNVQMSDIVFQHIMSENMGSLTILSMPNIKRSSTVFQCFQYGTPPALGKHERV